MFFQSGDSWIIAKQDKLLSRRCTFLIVTRQIALDVAIVLGFPLLCQGSLFSFPVFPALESPLGRGRRKWVRSFHPEGCTVPSRMEVVSATLTGVLGSSGTAAVFGRNDERFCTNAVAIGLVGVVILGRIPHLVQNMLRNIPCEFCAREFVAQLQDGLTVFVSDLTIGLMVCLLYRKHRAAATGNTF